MKLFNKNKTTLAALLFLLVCTTSVYAWGDRGQCNGCPCSPDYACGISGRCPGGGFPDRLEGRDDLTSEQKEQLIALRQKVMDDTAETRIALNTASKNLEILMGTSEPDKKAIQSLLKEISTLSATLLEKQINHQLEVRKIAPGLGQGKMPRHCPKSGNPDSMRDARKPASSGCCGQ
jgi:Spy/CpxP family protein refolding chaperone